MSSAFTRLYVSIQALSATRSRVNAELITRPYVVLHALKREAATANVQSALRNLPLDKLEKLGEIIAELNEAENATVADDTASKDT